LPPPPQAAKARIVVTVKAKIFVMAAAHSNRRATRRFVPTRTSACGRLSFFSVDVSYL
jgi:hypothetical protein